MDAKTCEALNPLGLNCCPPLHDYHSAAKENIHSLREEEQHTHTYTHKHTHTPSPGCYYDYGHVLWKPVDALRNMVAKHGLVERCNVPHHCIHTPLHTQQVLRGRALSANVQQFTGHFRKPWGVRPLVCLINEL